MQFPTVLTTPKPYGIQVEWQWPEGCYWFSKVEMQYISGDGQLNKQTIAWPLTAAFIGGLKAGERLQIRLRPINKDGVGRDWTNSDWIEGESSSNAGDYLDAITCGSDMRLMTSFSTQEFKVENGQVFINNACIPVTIHAAEPPKSKGGKVDINSNLEALLQNALANETAASKLKEIIDKCIEESIRLNCRPGGLIRNLLKR